MKLTKEQFHTIAPKRKDCKIISHYLYRKNETCFIVKDKVNIFLYILIVIPCIIINLGLCLWDGGLKKFEFPFRTIREDWIYQSDGAYKFLEQIERKA